MVDDYLVLTLPEGTQGFVVYCDASRVGLDFFCFMKNEKIIAYASRQVKVHEKHYPTHDLKIDRFSFCFEDMALLFLWCPC